MKGNKTFLYLVIFAALLIIAYFVTTDRGEKTSSYDLKENKLFEIDSAKVDKLEIKYKDGDLVLSKSTGEWKAVSPYDYNVVSSLVDKAVSGVKNMKLESIISTNPDKKELYGFKDSEQAEISVYESGVLKGKFLLGSSSADNSSYIKKPDNDIIYIADNIDRNNYVKPLINDWRDKRIVNIPKQGVNSIEFIYPDESFTVKKDSTGKFFVGQDTTGKVFDGILNLLEKFETNSFKDTLITDYSGFTTTVNIDWGNKTQMKFMKTNTIPAMYLLKVEGDNQIYALEDGYAINLLKKRKDILGN